MDLNKFIFTVRLTKDPEISATPNGIKVAKFHVACGDYRKDANGEKIDDTNFINNVTAFRGIAEVIEKYVHKGDRVLIEAKVQTSNKDGKFYTNFIVRELIMLSSKNSGQQKQGDGFYEEVNNNTITDTFPDDVAEVEIPF